MSIAKKVFLKMKSFSSSSSSAAATCSCDSTNNSSKNNRSVCTMIRRSSSLSSLSSLSSIGVARRRSSTRLEQLFTVSDLLEDKDWKTLREYLGTDRARNDILTNETTLHDACRIGAPADVICAISEMDPSARQRTDIFERTPLHIACGAYRDDSDSGITYASPPNGDVIDYLCSVCPTSMINDEDEDGRAPLEYAILNNVRFKTVDRMRKASEKAWKAAAAA